MSDPRGTLIAHPHLTQLSARLKAIDAGDRIVKGRLELFACSRKGLTKKQQEELLRRAPDCIENSALGPLASEQAQMLLANLTSLMSLVFVDYDCSALSPADFERCTDKHAVVNTINFSLASVVDRVHSGFLGEFWQAVQEAIDLAGCEIFAFHPTNGTFEPTDNSLMSFHYFFIDAQCARILFIGSVTKSKAACFRGRGVDDSESDVPSDIQDSISNSSKQHSPRTSSMESSAQEGEYCFSSEDGEDRMD